MRDVENKVAFITGGASGLGLAMARSFSAAGMKVVIADVQQDALDQVQAEFEGANAEMLPLLLDVTDRQAMETAADLAEEKFGKIHVMCNNAGVAVGGPIDDMSYEDWDWVMGVNLNGVINGVRTFVDRMKSHGEGGHFVNTASMAGHMAFANLSVYNTSKFAVVGLSEAMREDMAPHNIGVSVLCPGVVTTGIFDSGRNRPEALQREKDTASMVLNPDSEDLSSAERVEALFASALEPQVVGDMVLQGVIDNDAYIFTHPELKEATDARKQQMDEAFAKWSKYRSTQNV